MSAALDAERLLEGLDLARAVIGLTDPNPRVGCIIGSENGAVWGRGATQQAGGAHAEVMALRDAAAHGQGVTGGTAWVTLEPCAHHGRTPPCCDALIAAGLARVVVAVDDPFPAVAGAGVARLRAAGIRVDHAEAPIEQMAWELNIGFFSRLLRSRPWLRLKLATSLDGRTGLDNGISQWITSTAAREDGHRWRLRASAVLTGIGTVLSDNPRLDVRIGGQTTTPLRVVVDSRQRLPPDARLLASPGCVLVATATPQQPPTSREDGSNVETVSLPGREGRVNLPALFDVLAQRGVNEVHAECGPTLATALLQAGLVDEVLHYLAPRLLGGGRGIVTWPALDQLSDGQALQFMDVAAAGPDLRLRLLTRQGAQFQAMRPECFVGGVYNCERPLVRGHPSTD
jgi:diaminohydroxyphosphoribosylaminopyrimidine deaminase/5-amino-6-(5-phosphoribosylamino)uracil reductase